MSASTRRPAPPCLPLPPPPADTSVTRLARVTNRCRVTLDTNRYSVPHIYASQRLTLHAFADRLCLYHQNQLIATQTRSYERHRDFENPDHVRELLSQRQRARDAKWLTAFLALTPQAEHYHNQLQARHLSPRVHIRNIIALTEIHGADAVADAIECQAYSSQYIENILAQRQRPAVRPAFHPTFAPPPASTARLPCRKGNCAWMKGAHIGQR